MLNYDFSFGENAKISQLLLKKPLLLDLQDVWLHLKAGMPLNTVECTRMSLVLTRPGDLLIPLAAPSSAAAAETLVTAIPNQ